MTTGGRGAWTSNGHSNQSRQYELIAGKTTDGSERSKGDAYEAVNLGIQAIQQAINDQGYTNPLVTDGILGQRTQAGIKWVQTRMPSKTDGIAGQGTCTFLWRPYIKKYCDQAGIDPKFLFGQMMQESAADPGAVGYTNGSDHGLIQINLDTYTNITKAQAHDPAFALEWSALRLAAAKVKYSGKGSDLQLKAVILQHNSVVAADYLYAHGTYKSSTNEVYVNNITNYAAKW